MPSAFFPSSTQQHVTGARPTARDAAASSKNSTHAANPSAALLFSGVNGVGSNNISAQPSAAAISHFSQGTHAAKLSAISPAASAAGRPKSKLSFPSSRKYLWDRTACAATQYVQPKDYVPAVEVHSSVLELAQQQQRHGMRGGRVMQLLASLDTSLDGRSVRMLLSTPPIGASNIPAGRNQVLVPCTVEDAPQPSSTPSAAAALTPPPPSPSAAAANAALLRAAFRNSLDRHGPACLSQLLCASTTLHLRSDATGFLQGAMLTPGAPLSLTPLYAKRMCDTPLTQQLLGSSSSGSGGGGGFGGGGLQQKQQQMGPGANGLLTMDQARSVLPLAADDPNVYTVPLVGVWVRGVSNVNHAAVLAACLRFAFSSTLPDKATQPTDAFLLLLFPPESTSLPRCYEARFHSGPTPSHEAGSQLTLLHHSFCGELLQPAYRGTSPTTRSLRAGTPVVLHPGLDSSMQALVLGPPSPSLLSQSHPLNHLNQPPQPNASHAAPPSILGADQSSSAWLQPVSIARANGGANGSVNSGTGNGMSGSSSVGGAGVRAHTGDGIGGASSAACTQLRDGDAVGGGASGGGTARVVATGRAGDDTDDGLESPPPAPRPAVPTPTPFKGSGSGSGTTGRVSAAASRAAAAAAAGTQPAALAGGGHAPDQNGGGAHALPHTTGSHIPAAAASLRASTEAPAFSTLHPPPTHTHTPHAHPFLYQPSPWAPATSLPATAPTPHPNPSSSLFPPSATLPHPPSSAPAGSAPAPYPHPSTPPYTPPSLHTLRTSFNFSSGSGSTRSSLVRPLYNPLQPRSTSFLSQQHAPASSILSPYTHAQPPNHVPNPTHHTPYPYPSSPYGFHAPLYPPSSHTHHPPQHTQHNTEHHTHPQLQYASTHSSPSFAPPPLLSRSSASALHPPSPSSSSTAAPAHLRTSLDALLAQAQAPHLKHTAAQPFDAQQHHQQQHQHYQQQQQQQQQQQVQQQSQQPAPLAFSLPRRASILDTIAPPPPLPAAPQPPPQASQPHSLLFGSRRGSEDAAGNHPITRHTHQGGGVGAWTRDLLCEPAELQREVLQLRAQVRHLESLLQSAYSNNKHSSQPTQPSLPSSPPHPPHPLSSANQYQNHLTNDQHHHQQQQQQQPPDAHQQLYHHQQPQQPQHELANGPIPMQPPHTSTPQEHGFPSHISTSQQHTPSTTTTASNSAPELHTDSLYVHAPLPHNHQQQQQQPQSSMAAWPQPSSHHLHQQQQQPQPPQHVTANNVSSSLPSHSSGLCSPARTSSGGGSIVGSIASTPSSDASHPQPHPHPHPHTSTANNNNTHNRNNTGAATHPFPHSRALAATAAKQYHADTGSGAGGSAVPALGFGSAAHVRGAAGAGTAGEGSSVQGGGQGQGVLRTHSPGGLAGGQHTFVAGHGSKVPFRHAAASLAAAQAEAQAQGDHPPGFDHHQPRLLPHSTHQAHDQPLQGSQLSEQSKTQPHQQHQDHQHQHHLHRHHHSSHEHTYASQPPAAHELGESPPHHTLRTHKPRDTAQRATPQHSVPDTPRRPSSVGLSDIVRTKYVPLDDDSDSSDLEMEVHLMRKYGIK